LVAFAASAGRPRVSSIGSEIADPEEARVLMKPQAIPAINKTMTYGTPVAIVSIFAENPDNWCLPEEL
jgi:hypothetical protein